MTSTNKKVRYLTKSKSSAAVDDASSVAEDALKAIEGRWKLRILFHLNANPILRFSDLERAIPAVSQKMLIQQLRELERDGLVVRKVHPQVPPKVEYTLTKRGKDLCPALDELRAWVALGRPTTKGGEEESPPESKPKPPNSR